MATPCEELGYKVGDKFKVVCKESETCGFKKGVTITLYADDRSDCPLFAGDNTEYSLADGAAGAYLHLRKVKPLKPKKAKRPWIKWEGGECPLPKGTLVDVKYRDGFKQKGCPVGRTLAEFERNVFFEANSDPSYDIIAYRLAKPKQAAEPAQEAQAEPTVQREANGRPVGAKVGDWFRVVGDTAYGEVGDIVQFIRDDLSPCPWFLGDNTDGESPIHWHSLEPCPAPSQPEPEPAKPEWEILWGSEKDFEGAPDWAVYVLGERSFAEDVIKGCRLMFGVSGREDTVNGLANTKPKAARRLKQPK